jgi:hypothetical protein
MVPLDLHDFLIACLGASASFIGLLFVGLSVVLQQQNKLSEKLADSDRLLAESSFTGLINIFFVSLTGILQQSTIGWVSLIMAAIGLLNSWRLSSSSNVVPIVISAVIYILEIIFGIFYIFHSSQPLNIGVFETIITSLFAISLFRAWGLTGIRQS